MSLKVAEVDVEAAMIGNGLVFTDQCRRRQVGPTATKAATGSDIVPCPARLMESVRKTEKLLPDARMLHRCRRTRLPGMGKSTVR